MMPALALLWILGGTFIEAAITTLVVSWLIGESFQWSVTVLFWLMPRADSEIQLGCSCEHGRNDAFGR